MSAIIARFSKILHTNVFMSSTQVGSIHTLDCGWRIKDISKNFEKNEEVFMFFKEKQKSPSLVSPDDVGDIDNQICYYHGNWCRALTNEPLEFGDIVRVIL